MTLPAGQKYPCLYPLPDGSRCCECDACQNPHYVPPQEQAVEARRPTFVDGIGPPLEQIWEDHDGQPHGRLSKDVRCLITEVYRLTSLLSQREEELVEAREAVRISYPKTPVDCLLSTLTEIETWTLPGDDAMAVREALVNALSEARAALSRSNEGPQ